MYESQLHRHTHTFYEWKRGEWTFYRKFGCCVCVCACFVFLFIQFHNWHRLWSSFFPLDTKVSIIEFSLLFVAGASAGGKTSQTALQLENWMKNPT